MTRAKAKRRKREQSICQPELVSGSKLTMANLRGMPLSFISKQLPLKSWFNLTTLLHIHLHSKYSGNNKPDDRSTKKNNGFSLEKIKSLQKMVFKSISKWKKPHQFVNHWSTYYENDIESQEYLKDKEATIRKWLEIIKPNSVIDLGANTGKFSFIAAEYAERVISIEGDERCVNQIEHQIKENNFKQVFTLIGNIAESSPTIGILNDETVSIFQRGESDLVLSLALIHHLHFSNKLSFEQIVDVFFNFSSNYLIVEFIPNSDNKVKYLLKNKIFDLKNFNENLFLNSFKNKFSLIEKVKLNYSDRMLFLFIKVK